MHWWKSGLRSRVLILDLGVTWMELIVNEDCEKQSRAERLWPKIWGGGKFGDKSRRRRNLSPQKDKRTGHRGMRKKPGQWCKPRGRGSGSRAAESLRE